MKSFSNVLIFDAYILQAALHLLILTHFPGLPLKLNKMQGKPFKIGDIRARVVEILELQEKAIVH